MFAQESKHKARYDSILYYANIELSYQKITLSYFNFMEQSQILKKTTKKKAPAVFFFTGYLHMYFWNLCTFSGFQPQNTKLIPHNLRQSLYFPFAPLKVSNWKVKKRFPK